MVAPPASRTSGTNPGSTPRFYTVTQAARLIGTAPVTLYRAIRDGEFPALRIRGRLIVPAQAIDAMIDAAINEQAVVDVAVWVSGEATPGTSQSRVAAVQAGDR